ncbi:hypothetical protein ACP70R_003163 [Stipagrostis hirtigluma subsp. patula]
MMGDAAGVDGGVVRCDVVRGSRGGPSGDIDSDESRGDIDGGGSRCGTIGDGTLGGIDGGAVAAWSGPPFP